MHQLVLRQRLFSTARWLLPVASILLAHSAAAQTAAVPTDKPVPPEVSASCNAEADALQLKKQDKLNFVMQCEQRTLTPPKRVASEKQLAHRQKMRDCNAKAKTDALKGDERKAFMKQCLRKDKPATEQPGAK